MIVSGFRMLFVCCDIGFKDVYVISLGMMVINEFLSWLVIDCNEIE